MPNVTVPDMQLRSRNRTNLPSQRDHHRGLAPHVPGQLAPVQCRPRATLNSGVGAGFSSELYQTIQSISFCRQIWAILLYTSLDQGRPGKPSNSIVLLTISWCFGHDLGSLILNV